MAAGAPCCCGLQAAWRVLATRSGVCKCPLGDIIDRRDVAALEGFLKSHRQAPPGLVEALREAVKEGDANASPSSQRLPLHEAVRFGSVQVVEDLLRAGARPSVRDAAGETALEVAESCRSSRALLAVLRRAQDTRWQNEFDENLAWIPNVPLLSEVQPSEYPRLAAAFTRRRYSRGRAVVQEGEPGHELFVIESGTARVLMGGREVATLGAGQHFGEVALLTDAPRNATVVAGDELSVKRLTRADFESLELKRQVTARKAIRQADVADDKQQKLDPLLLRKTAADIELIRQALQKNLHLGPMLNAMSSDVVGEIIAHAHLVSVKSGDSVVTQGELRADLFYVVQDGTFDIIKDGKTVACFASGTSFGELALLYRAPRAATVKATSPGRLWAISRQDLRMVMQAPLRRKLDRWAALLESVAVLKDVPQQEKRLLADALVETVFHQNEYIIVQGDVGDTFYILDDGEVAVEVNGREVTRLSGLGDQGTAGRGFFGERALLEDEPRAASVRVVSQRVVVLALHRGIFTQVVKRQEPPTEADSMITYSLDRLVKLSVLGYGGFGTVHLVECTQTKHNFALKAVSKGHVVQQRQEGSIMNEQRILRMTNSPFLVRLAATFNSREFLYFLIEPVLGGELFTIYQRNRLYGKEAHARFYIACVVMAFEHLHQRRILYRDLKPENVLLDTSGYAKVTDFGLAKFVVGHTYTTCGTPDYFAPEMIMGSGHTLAVDWWTLGVMTYELIVSDAPFSAHEHMAIFKKVKRGIESAKFPNRSASWAKLVMELCKQEPGQRLPMRRGGVMNIKQSSWYSRVQFDWSSLAARTMVPPYIPQVKSKSDASNFEPCSESDGPPHIPYVDPGTGWDEGFGDPHGPAFD